jgi:O-antigen ligase
MFNMNTRLKVQTFVTRHEPLLLRGAVVSAALLLAALVGLIAAVETTFSLLVAGLYFAVAGGLVLMRWPGVGFPLIILASLVIPFSIGTGTETSINLSFLLVVAMTGLWLLEMVAQDRQIRLAPSRPVLPLLLFMGATLISLGFGQMMWFPTRSASIAAQFGGAAIFIVSGIAFLLAAHRMDVRWLKWTVAVFIAVSSVYMLGELVNPIKPIIFRIFQRAVLDSLFWTWFLAMSFSQAFLNNRLSLPLRGLIGLMALSSVYITFVIKQDWTSGWLPAVVGVFVILLLTKPKLAIPAAFVMGILLLIRAQAAHSFIMAGDNEYSMMTRLEAWKIMLEIIRVNPLFGVGPSNYYFYTPFFNILGYNLRFNSHNNYMDILAQTGLVGLVLFTWFSVAVGRLGMHLRHRASEGFEKAFVYGALGGLAGTLVAGMLGDWVLPFVYNVGMAGFRASVLAWLFLGSLVMLEQKYRLAEKSAEEG